MATPVCLADISPFEAGDGWDKQATEVFKKMTWMKELLMFVKEEQSMKSPCKVLLYEMLQDRDICVNAWMVKEGKAVSISGSTMEYQKEVIPVENTDVGVHSVCSGRSEG